MAEMDVETADGTSLPTICDSCLKKKNSFSSISASREVGETTRLWPSRPSAREHGGTASEEEVDGTELPLQLQQPTLDPAVTKKHIPSQLTPLRIGFLVGANSLYPNTECSHWSSQMGKLSLQHSPE